jgi:uncharacterized protein
MTPTGIIPFGVKMTASNPFHFGSPAIDPHFCDRDAEVAALIQRMHGGVHAFLLGPRRYGKSSIVQRALHRFRRAGGRAGYADLILCTSEAEVAQAVLGATVEGVLSGPRKARESLESLLRGLRVAPSVSFGPDGALSLSFDPVVAQRSWQAILDDALAILDQAAKRGPVALALDEFQHVAEIGRSGMGGAFKAAADRLTGASLVLSGSHMTAMEKLTRERGAPLQGMGELLVVGSIPRREMDAHLQRRARAGGKRLTRDAADSIHLLGGDVPNDLQWLAYAAYEAAGAAAEIEKESVERGFEAIVQRQSSSFAERFEMLAPSQQRVLKALAAASTAKLYTGAFLATIQVANANAVRKAVGVLVDAELVRRREGVHEVASPFMRAWLVRRET